MHVDVLHIMYRKLNDVVRYIVVPFLIILVPCSLLLSTRCAMLSVRSHSHVGPLLFTLVCIMDMLE
jgi:hypothetical protein